MKYRTIGLIFVLLLIAGYDVAESYTYYVPYFSEVAGGGTSLAIRNCSSTKSANVRWVVYNQIGTEVPGTRSVVLPPDGHWADVIQTGNPGEVGSMVVYSTQQLAGLCFFFIDGFMLDVPFSSEPAKKFIVPHGGVDSIWDTAIYISV